MNAGGRHAPLIGGSIVVLACRATGFRTFGRAHLFISAGCGIVVTAGRVGVQELTVTVRLRLIFKRAEALDVQAVDNKAPRKAS